MSQRAPSPPSASHYPLHAPHGIPTLNQLAVLAGPSFHRYRRRDSSDYAKPPGESTRACRSRFRTGVRRRFRESIADDSLQVLASVVAIVTT